MQYQYQQGVHYSWLENARLATAEVPAGKWLPVGIAAIMSLWLTLVFVSVLQKLPTSPGAISHHPATSTGKLVVSTSKGSTGQGTTNDQAMLNGVMSTNAVTGLGDSSNSQIASVSSTASSTVADTTDTVGDVTGGTGGDGTGTTVASGSSDDGTTTQTTVTTPVVDTTVDVNTTPQDPSVGITVDTPVTPPITLDTGSLTNNLLP